MKMLLRIIPIFAFVAAITAAFATQDDTSLEVTKKALNSSGQWVDITGQEEGTDYDCDEAVQTCTQLFDEMGNEIPNTEVEGKYIPRNP